MSGEDVAFDMIRSSIVLVLSEKPLHGYGIMKEVENRIGKPVNPSLLYPFLKQLEKNDLVRSTKKPVGQKPKNIYELTTTGRELAVRIYKRIASMVSLAIEPNLSICFHCSCKIYEGGYREVIGERELVFCCVHCAQAYKNELSSTQPSEETRERMLE
ncbi:MAG: helix-turn-helix transcriptional regulator [Candidatus Bathyarchaeota archaeon]|nr:MAG: helix-turn-helix transcriptional regulator [Candidatus Bathyarchaeota archaeon]